MTGSLSYVARRATTPERAPTSSREMRMMAAAAGGGAVMEKFSLFGAASKYFQAIGYTSTVLFHMLPAITDFLRRLPLGDPFVDSFDDPLLVNFHLALLALYAVGLGSQLLWLKAQSRALENELSGNQEPSVL